MKRALAAALVLLPLAAHGQATTSGTGQQWRQDRAINNSPNSPSAASMSAASTGASTSRAEGGSATANGGSTRNQVVVAPALPGMASGPCTGAGGGLSIGIVGFAGGVGGTSVDPRCTARETARVAAMVGLHDEAREIMREEVRRVLGREPAAAAAPMPYNAGGN